MGDLEKAGQILWITTYGRVSLSIRFSSFEFCARTRPSGGSHPRGRLLQPPLGWFESNAAGSSSGELILPFKFSVALGPNLMDNDVSFSIRFSAFRHGRALRLHGASEPGTGCASPPHTRGTNTLRAQAIPSPWATWRRRAKSYGLRHMDVCRYP